MQKKETKLPQLSILKGIEDLQLSPHSSTKKGSIVNSSGVRSIDASLITSEKNDKKYIREIDMRLN